MERDIGRDILGLRIELIETHPFLLFFSCFFKGKNRTCVDGGLLHSRGRASGGGGARGGWRKTHMMQ